MGNPLPRLWRWMLGRSLVVILSGIVLVAGVPAVAVIVASSLDARQVAERQAREDMRNLTRGLVAIQTHVTDQAQALLTTLAHAVALDERDLHALNRLFALLLSENPAMSNFFLTDVAGRVIASGLPSFVGVDLSDRTYYQTAMKRRGLGVSKFIRGRATQAPILAYALTDRGHGDAFSGVIGLSYYLEGYERFLQGLELPYHARVTLLDADGRRMVAYPARADFPLGKPATPHLWQRFRDAPEDIGFFIDNRQNGQEGLFSFARLRLGPDQPPYMTIIVSSARGEAFALADLQLRRGLFEGVGAIVLALLIAQLAGRVAIGRGVATLGDAAARLAGGDLAVRVPDAGGSLEIRRLGHSFNAMAEALETRQRELEQALAALGRMRSMLNNILESMPSAIIGLDDTGHLTHINNTAASLFGLDRDMVGRVSAASLPVLSGQTAMVDKALRERRSLVVEKLAIPRSGDTQFMDMLLYPLVANGTEGVVIRFDDVTERERALEEKTILLQEIHHRVKNNLQIILSFIGLQADEAEDPGERDRLRRLEIRIRSMALVHQQLYSHGDIATVDLAEYVKTLSESVLALFPGLARRVELVFETAPVRLSLDKAVPCGLLLGELLTNACKHAFPPGTTGELCVGCRQENGQALVWVQDDGVGLPATVVFEEAATMGLTLVKELARQLQGNVRRHTPPGGGLRLEATFPL